jgi:DNA-binding MarR family transcriptional regulator
MQPLLAAHLAFKKHILAGLKEYGIKTGQPKILLCISSYPGCQQKDIAENCYVETATLSSVLSHMEKLNLIERRQNAKDKRSYSIYPTEEAQPLYEAVEERFKKTMSVALSGFTEEEVKQFTGYLERMEKNLSESMG